MATGDGPYDQCKCNILLLRGLYAIEAFAEQVITAGYGHPLKDETGKMKANDSADCSEP